MWRPKSGRTGHLAQVQREAPFLDRLAEEPKETADSILQSLDATDATGESQVKLFFAELLFAPDLLAVLRSSGCPKIETSLPPVHALP